KTLRGCSSSRPSRVGWRACCCLGNWMRMRRVLPRRARRRWSRCIWRGPRQRGVVLH
ncbi:hypothetical protein FRC12_010878, partial [Ceratobasidium sp. 428]